jgi:hypothetical protein
MVVSCWLVVSYQCRTWLQFLRRRILYFELSPQRHGEHRAIPRALYVSVVNPEFFGLLNPQPLERTDRVDWLLCPDRLR